MQQHGNGPANCPDESRSPPSSSPSSSPTFSATEDSADPDHRPPDLASPPSRGITSASHSAAAGAAAARRENQNQTQTQSQSQSRGLDLNLNLNPNFQQPVEPRPSNTLQDSWNSPSAAEPCRSEPSIPVPSSSLSSAPNLISAPAPTPPSSFSSPGLSTTAGCRLSLGLASSSREAGRSLTRPPIPAKRPSGQSRGSDSVMHPSPIKKPRTGASPPRKVEIPPTSKGPLHPTTTRKAREGSHSPLFFSHTPSKNINRQLSFPASEPAASMLARLRDDPSGGVTTLKLPRASVSSISPGRSESTPGSWGSSMEISVPSAPSLTPDSRNLPPGLQMLQGIGVIELLEQDERPTFLIDLGNSANASRAGLHILYYNASLRASHEVLELLSVDQEDSNPDTDFGRFKSWIMETARSRESSGLRSTSHTYAGITWTCSTLRRRFRFVSGNVGFVNVRPGSPPTIGDEEAVQEQRSRGLSPTMPVTPEAELPLPLPDEPDYFGNAAAVATAVDPVASSVESGSVEDIPEEDLTRLHPDDFTNQVFQSQPISKSIFDWTRIPISEMVPGHVHFARSADWGSTPLGPIEDWPHDLRAMSNLVMGSPHPAAMYWGPQFVAIYNAAYLDLAGKKHPSLMGQCYADAWVEIWDEIQPIFKSAWESGQATMKHENQLFINRHGFLEETFFSWSIVPLVGAEGEVVGLYNPAFENTRRRVNERRMLALREVGERTAAATTVCGFWPQVYKALEVYEHDVPFALIYSVKDESESESSSLHSGSFTHPPQLVLEGSLGVPSGHPVDITSIDLRQSDEGFAPYMRQSMTSGGAPITLSLDDGTLPHHLIEGIEWRGFGDPCRTLVVLPVVPTTAGESVVGFIVIGTNPRRPYDDDYKLFVHLLSRQLATSMASVVLFEEEIKRGQRAARLAALDRQELSDQLYLRTQEAVESEYRFTRMAEFAPVGMFIADSTGKITYCNDMWWQISRHSRSEETVDAWMNSVRDEDRQILQSSWNRLVEEKTTISLEFRFKCSQRDGENTIDTWVLMSAFPEKTHDGELKSIFGCITDISSQKWAEKVQNERREEAVELKRQQENFIDITSHEMRNPLSAILQCADQIANNISTFESHGDRGEVENLLEGCLDAANTINLCASHQKRIVDDILTLSKLDSNLLSVTPVDDQPVRVVQRALKMFESELLAHDIEMDFRVDDSFERYGLKWARLDPSRLRQILINLMTNAIKFTQGRERRLITVSLCASRDVSEVTSRGIFYFDRIEHQRAALLNIDNTEEWGDGEVTNIHCSVEDTGPGLGDEETKVLFQRFQQATPRTHVQYGGSGLGLFISRILTEMQGGQIGVTSEEGVGSRFSFYIKSRRCANPPSDYELITPFKIARKPQSPATPTKPELTRQNSRSPSNNPGQLFDVLIVEDNIVNQKVLQRQLRNCGNNTFVANHGKEALQTIQRSRFWAGKESEGVDISVILMDLEMPVMDGMTCARRIRELEREGTIVQHIPIIAVTAYARPEQIESAKAAGIVSFDQSFASL